MDPGIYLIARLTYATNSQPREWFAVPVEARPHNTGRKERLNACQHYGIG